MPTFDIKPENASLVLVDTPVGYVPARGPAMPFTLTYDYRQLAQPQVFTFTHLGPRWTLHWVSFAQEVPTWVNPFLSNESVPEHVAVYLRGGGEETFIAPASGTTYPRHWRSRAQLVRVSDTPIRYERQLPDSSVEVFGQPDPPLSPDDGPCRRGAPRGVSLLHGPGGEYGTRHDRADWVRRLERGPEPVRDPGMDAAGVGAGSREPGDGHGDPLVPQWLAGELQCAGDDAQPAVRPASGRVARVVRLSGAESQRA